MRQGAVYQISVLSFVHIRALSFVLETALSNFVHIRIELHVSNSKCCFGIACNKNKSTLKKILPYVCAERACSNLINFFTNDP